MTAKHFVIVLFLATLAFAACTIQPVPTAVTPTQVAIVEATERPTLPAPLPTSTFPLVTPTRTPKPTPDPSKSLTICLGAEPDSLFLYGSSMLVKNNILEAIYDGPIDPLSFDYRPVILEKLPSLADADARIVPVPVKAGDWVVNDAGRRVHLEIGDIVRPYGCNQADCAIAWDGSPLEMAQLSADFKLLPNIRWSDGEPLTARDTIYSYQVALDCPNAQYCAPAAGLPGWNQETSFHNTAAYTQIDELTVRWIGLPGFLDPYYRTNFFTPLPEHLYGDLSINELMESEETRTHPIGWGAYIIDKYIQGSEIRLSKNPYYFRASEGLPRFEKLTFKFVGQNSPANIASLLGGQCDLMDQNAALDDSIAELLALDAKGLLQFHYSNALTWEHLDFGLQPSSYDDGYQIGVDRPDFFGDARTRRAVALCLDRQRMNSESYILGLSEIPNTFIPSNHPLYNPEIESIPFDQKAGQALLTEVGWIEGNRPDAPRIAHGVANVPDGTPFIVSYITTNASIRQQVGQILVESLAGCGIQVHPQYLPAADLFEGPDRLLYGRNFDLAEFAWLADYLPTCELYMTENIPGDPEALNQDGTLRFPRGWEGENVSGYSNPEYDQACRAAQAALPGQPEFIPNYQKTEAIFAQDLPAIPLFTRIKVTAAGADLCGYRMDPSANSDTWDIEVYSKGDCR